MSIFIKKTLYDVIKNYNIKNTIFIAPNEKYIYTLLSVYRKIKKNVFTPNPVIYTLLEIMQIISGISLIEKNLLEIYFYKILYKKISKYYFKKLIENNIINILYDFNNIDINLVDSDIFFKNINSYNEIDTSSYINIFKGIKNDRFPFWKIISECYNELKLKLLNKKTAYKGLIFRQSYKYINEYINNNADIDKFIFIGIIINNNSELFFIKKLLSINKAKFYLDIDRYYYNNKINESGIFIKKKLLQLKLQNDIKWMFDDFCKYKTIKIIGTQGQISQLKIVNEIIDNIENNIHNTVIIIPDNNINIIPIIYSISKKLVDLNIHITFFLKISSINYSCLKIYKLFYNRVINNIDGFFIDDIISLINDNYINLILNSIGKNIKKIFYLKNNKKNIITDNEIKILFKQDKILKIINSKNIISYNLLSTLTFFLKKIKNLLLSNNKKKYELYIDIIFINELDFWIKKNLYMNWSIEKLFFLYKNWIKVSQSVININNKKSISLMDVFNASSKTFDNVIIISANEGSFPNNKNYEKSFIPYDISKKFNIYNNKEQNYIYAYHFYLLIQRCKNIFFIYDNNSKGFFLGEKSRFIYQIMHESMHKINIIENYNKNINIDNQKLNLMYIKKNDLIMKKINNFFLYKGFSSSSINLYINNPIDFYIYKILRLKQKNHDFNKLGMIIHKVLEFLYKKYINIKLNLSIIEKMISSVDFFIIKYLKYKNFDNNIDYIYFINPQIIKEYVKKIILWDKKSIIDGNEITIKYIEYNISFFYNKYKTKIIGIIDRIDIFNGSLRIIDYKTGIIDKKYLKINSKNNFNELLNNHLYNKSLQLMIYAKLFFIKNDDIKFVYPIIFSLKSMNHLIIDNNLGISFNDVKKFSSVLMCKLQEIKDPNIPFVGQNIF